jgi:hypothetical protein
MTAKPKKTVAGHTKPPGQPPGVPQSGAEVFSTPSENP